MHKFLQAQNGTARVTILVSVIVLASIWAISLYSNFALEDGMQNTLSEAQLSTATIIAAQVNDELEHRLNVLTAMAGQLKTGTTRDAAQTQAFLSARPMIQEEFNSGVFVVDVHGTAIADFPVIPGRVGTNYMDREAVSLPLREGRHVIGKPSMGKALKAPVFSIVVPIQDERGEITGAVVGTINLGLPNFLDKLSKSSYGKSGGYMLVAPQYRLIVTASDKSRVMEVLPPAGLLPARERLMADGDVTEIFINSRGVELLASGASVPASGWRVIVSVPTSEALASVSKLQQHVLLAAMIASVLSCTTTWWLLKSQRAAELALYDPLTHLANRRLLMDRLGQTMANSQRGATHFALMVLDLDNFKPLNDRHGHLAGDLLLVEAANRLKQSVRDIDTVARFGGDEFVVVLGELDANQTSATSQAHALAEKIRMALAEPYLLKITEGSYAQTVVEHRCTVSIGVAIGMGHTLSQDRILKSADSSMYLAKEAGRNQVKMARQLQLQADAADTGS